jgi:hypothetical protein
MLAFTESAGPRSSGKVIKTASYELRADSIVKLMEIDSG